MNKKLLILLLIVLFGLLLRYFYSGIIPPGLNRDEASIGYTAYSLFKTAKDEYGRFLPLSIESFGDWKLPLYIYTDILPVALFSLNEFSVRFPSLIFGTLTILVVYFLVKRLFEDISYNEVLALISSFLFAISPWHIHFSRVASEANLAVFLTSLGLLLFFKGLKSNIFLYSSAIALALTLYTYHGNHVFTILIFLALLFILIKQKATPRSFFAFFFLFTIINFFILKETLLSADRVKISGLLPVSNPFLVYEKISQPRLSHSDPNSVITLVTHNKLIFQMEYFLQNYLRSFSPEFLFIKGGTNLSHNIPNFGNLYLWESPFIILGLYFLFQKKIKWRLFLLYWLLISPIPASLTRDAPHSARMLAFLPLPHLLAALGFIEFVFLIKMKPVLLAVYLSICLLLIVNLYLFLDRYFIHFPKESEVVWGGGYKELVSEVASLLPYYSEILMDRPDQSPYIYFLFYQRFDPATYQKKAVRYPKDSEGFHHVKKLEKITFKRLDWSDDLIIPGRLLVTWAESTPPSATKSAVLVDKQVLDRVEGESEYPSGLTIGEDEIVRRIIKIIRFKNGQPQFYLIDIGKVKRETPKYE